MANENEGKTPGEQKAPKAAKAVSRVEFDELSNTVNTGFATILEKLDQKTPEAPAVPEVTKSAATIANEGGPGGQSLVPPAWRALTDEILGSDFEIELELPENGGQKFSVYIPLDKSNAHKDYIEAYKKDKRTRELGNTGVKGVTDWLLKIRRNLISSGIKLPYYEDNQPTMISTR